MKSGIKIICFLMMLLVMPYKVYGFTIEDSNYLTHAKQDLLVLMLAYPEQIIDIEKDSNGFIYVVMKDGKIIEQGNHDTLLAQNGFYANLYNSQFAS